MPDRFRMNDSQPHGTEAARRTHLAKGEPPCAECSRVVGVLDMEEGWLPEGLAGTGDEEVRRG